MTKYYKNGNTMTGLPNKTKIGDNWVFNPTWAHFEADGWKPWPEELEGVESKYIRWEGGEPVEMTQEQKDAVDAEAKAQRIKSQIDTVLRRYQEVEEANTTSIGTVMLLQWSQAGFPKSQAVAAWFQTLYDERDTKLNQLDAGVEVDPEPSMHDKPYTFREMRDETLTHAA